MKCSHDFSLSDRTNSQQVRTIAAIHRVLTETVRAWIENMGMFIETVTTLIATVGTLTATIGTLIKNMRTLIETGGMLIENAVTFQGKRLFLTLNNLPTLLIDSVMGMPVSLLIKVDERLRSRATRIAPKI